jgi:hypothetical protein
VVKVVSCRKGKNEIVETENAGSPYSQAVLLLKVMGFDKVATSFLH